MHYHHRFRDITPRNRKLPHPKLSHQINWILILRILSSNSAGTRWSTGLLFIDVVKDATLCCRLSTMSSKDNLTATGLFCINELLTYRRKSEKRSAKCHKLLNPDRLSIMSWLHCPPAAAGSSGAFSSPHYQWSWRHDAPCRTKSIASLPLLLLAAAPLSSRCRRICRSSEKMPLRVCMTA